MFEGNLRIRLRDFVRELRRRKVIRATIAYAIAGVGIAEGAAIFLPPLGAPAWVPNIIAVIVVLGFPVALVLAWAFDIVPDTDEKPGVHNEAEAGSAVSATREPRSATRMEGERLGHYDVLERLGAGGMGVVYKARDTRLDRVVAFKVLSDHLLADDDARERFLIEAKAAAALDHPNICAIHEVGETEDDRFYIAMQYYEGETLRQRIDKGPIPLDEALDIATQVCHGLAIAADHGIIHRDIKPANIILTADGTVKIVDFGLAKYAGSGVTSTGTHVGTIAYMSPEQTRGDEVDQRTDIWSIGVVLYEMLSGTRPFRGGSDQAVINTILNSKPETLSGLVPSLPPNVVAVVDRATHKDPDRRYLDARAILKDLELLADDSSCQISLESAPSLPAEGERRRVTVIACSIDGFEILLESLDPDAAENSLQALRATVEAVVEGYGGRLNEFSEEKFVALFGVPNTHEDDRLRAVRAALEIMADAAVQEGLADAIRLRIAVGSEQVAIRATETGERRYRVGGNVVRDSTRLAMMARVGEILMLPDFARIVGPFVVTEERDAVRLLPDQPAIAPVAVLGESGHSSRLEASQPGSLTRFVGRRNELAALSQALEDTRSGAGRFVTVVSDVGVGKSRLLFEFWQSLEDQNVRSTMGRCREHGSLTPWLPFVASMKEMLGLPQVLGDDAHDEVVEKTRELAAPLEDYLPVILHILSTDSDQYPLPSYLEGEDLQAALVEALISVFTLGSAGRPLVMLLEDWHWADEGSREVLFQLREMIETYPLMVVVTSRPVPAGEGSMPSGDVHLELAPLRGDPEVAMLSAALSGARIPEELSARISEKTGGNPFFIEELCRTLIESGALVLENGEAILAGGIDKLLIPDTVQAVLKSRLDRLDPEAREVLRCAAVIGRRFGLELLSEVVPSRQRVDAALETLRSAGLVHRSGLVPEPTYRFKHALTLDVTYESLLERQKKERHAIVGEAIEKLYPDRIEEYSIQLAAHFAAAEDWDRAIRYGTMAAQRATALWRLPETAEMLMRVRQWIQSSDKNPGNRAKLLVPLLLELERHLEKLGRRDEQQSVIDELDDLLSTDVPTRNRGEVLVRQGDLYTLLAKYDKALPAFTQALEIAEQLDDPELRCKALRSLGHVMWSQARYGEAVPWLEQVIEFDREHTDTSPLVTDLCNLGRAVRNQEQWDRAMAIGDEILGLANDSGNPIDQLYAYNYKGHLFRAMKQTDTAIQAFEEGAQRAQEARIPAREAFCILGAAALYLETGRYDDALAAYRRSVKLARRANRADQLAQSLLLLADALVTYGELEESIANFNEAVTVLRRIGTEEPLASALSQLAAAQQSADSAGAEKTWREALEIYERLGDRQSTMAALERLAVLRRSADRSETRQLFGRALALATELEDGATEARIRNSLAVIAWQCGEIEEAEKQYRMAAALLRQGDNGESLGVVLNGLGAVVARQNRAGDALVILEEALASNRKHGQTGAEADSLAALGAAARIEGDLKDAGTWYQQCVECRRSQDDRAGEGWALQRLGEVSHDAGEWEKAQAFASAALAIGREVGDTDLESLASKLQSTDNTQKPD